MRHHVVEAELLVQAVGHAVPDQVRLVETQAGCDLDVEIGVGARRAVSCLPHRR